MGRLKIDPKVLFLVIVIVGIALIIFRIINQKTGKGPQ
jgi:hypothetical protein